MPVYQYRCTVCEHQFDVMQTMNDPPILQCEQCGKPVRKVISSSGLVFKGSGWYVTDYGTRKKDEPAKTDKKTERPPPSSASGAPGAPGGADPGASEKKTAPAGSEKAAPTSTSSPAPPKADPAKGKLPGS